HLQTGAPGNDGPGHEACAKDQNRRQKVEGGIGLLWPNDLLGEQLQGIGDGLQQSEFANAVRPQPILKSRDKSSFRPDGEDDDGVGEFVAYRDLRQAREIYERRWADVVSVRVRRAVGDEIEADLAFGSLDAGISLALRGLQHLRHLGADISLADGIQSLLQ